MTKLSWELKILVVIASLYTIALSQTILFPILLAFFLYLILSPIMEFLVSIKIPRVIASALISFGILGLIGVAIIFLIPPASKWIEDAPTNLHIIENKFKFVTGSLREINQAAESAQAMTEIDKKQSIKVSTDVGLGSSIFNLTSNIIFFIGTILLLLFFFLLYFKAFIIKLEKILQNKKKISSSENPFILCLKNQVSKYLSTFSIICIGFGTVMALIFFLLGLPNAFLWGVMLMLLTFIPYLGHLIGIIVILFVSFITFDSYIQIFSPPIIYFLMAVLEGQIITPIFLGKRLNLNPLFIFLNILIWGWLWGVQGAVISIPILITVKLILESIPLLSKYTILLEK